MAAGCKTSEPARVSVDMNLLVATRFIKTLPRVTPMPPAANWAASTSTPGIAPKTLTDADTNLKIEPTVQVHELENSEAERLRRRVERINKAELLKFERDQIKATMPELEKIHADIDAAIYEAVKVSAEARKGPMARIALLVGHPDPDPKPKAPPPGLSPLQKKQFDEVEAMRAKLRAADSAFQARVADILREERSQVALIDARVKELVMTHEQELLRKAAAETVSDTQGDITSLGLQLAEMHPKTMAGVTPKQQTYMAPALTAASIDLKTEVYQRSVQDIRSQLESEVAIWMKVAGYRLAPASTHVRDATSEFLKWRRSTMAGPSAN